MNKKIKYKIVFFAEIGKTNLSSNASELLLKNLVRRLNFYQKNKVAKIFFYPIFSPKNILNWFLFVPVSSEKKTSYFFSTSIKLLRDILYIFTSVMKIIYLKPEFSFFYNLNKLQIKILFFIRLFFKVKLNLIQADGYLFNSKTLNIFDNVIVFSNYSYQKYKNYFGIYNLYFSYPTLSGIQKNKFISNIDNKNFKILHAGSISSYNVCKESIKKIFEFCESHKTSKVYFTLNQRKIPEYFNNLLEVAPSNFIFKGFMSEEKLKILIKKMDIGLDLRNYKKENTDFNKCDFPSKVIFYIKNNLFVLSTNSKSIPNYLRDCFIPIKDIGNLENINFDQKELQINKILMKVDANSIDKVIHKNFKLG